MRNKEDKTPPLRILGTPHSEENTRSWDTWRGGAQHGLGWAGGCEGVVIVGQEEQSELSLRIVMIWALFAEFVIGLTTGNGVRVPTSGEVAFVG